ncbi:DUF1493 family protein [Patiriisocius marinistellae]|uniref:DUF1493 family protein n=1 Tax=Patiriisocius marinistellae TaxID=2494560 RepID=UPI0015629112|nr:DUF1493 family protein [Patiriisocius marinistellae]
MSERLLINVTNKTVFFNDLGLDGIDLETFILEFMEEFKIDFSLFNLEEYTLEGVNLYQIWFKGRKPKTFNVNHLEKVIAVGKWYDPSEIEKYILTE